MKDERDAFSFTDQLVHVKGLLFLQVDRQGDLRDDKMNLLDRFYNLFGSERSKVVDVALMRTHVMLKGTLIRCRRGSIELQPSKRPQCVASQAAKYLLVYNILFFNHILSNWSFSL